MGKLWKLRNVSHIQEHCWGTYLDKRGQELSQTTRAWKIRPGDFDTLEKDSGNGSLILWPDHDLLDEHRKSLVFPIEKWSRFDCTELRWVALFSFWTLFQSRCILWKEGAACGRMVKCEGEISALFCWSQEHPVENKPNSLIYLYADILGPNERT